MYPTSSAYKEAVQKTDRTWKAIATVYLDSGDVLELTDRDFAFNGFNYKECSTCGNTIQVGSTYSNSFDLALVNDGGRFNEYNFSDARVVPSIGLKLEDGSYEYVPLGIFHVNSVGKKKVTIPLKCLDGLSKANRPLGDASLAFPISLAAAVTNVCNVCGISFDTNTYNAFSAYTTQIQEFDVSRYTCRDFLGFAAALIGCNVRMNRNGILETFWYEATSVHTSPSTRVKTSEYDDLDVSVTGISYKDSEGVVTLVGTDDYVFELKVNPLISSDEALVEYAQTVLTVLSAMPYRPCTVYHMGDPSWQAGDIVTHEFADGSTFVAPIMQHTWKFRGTSTLKAVGQTKEANRQLTAAARTLLAYQEQARQDLNQGLTSMQQIMLHQSELITSALGFYPYVEYNTDGSVKGVYLMSTPEDSETTIVWAFTGGGIGISHTGIAGPYTSTWTIDDTIVANVVNANMIRTGILQDRNGGNTFYLDLDNGILRMGSYYTKEESDEQIEAYFRFIDGKLYIGDVESNIQLVESGDKVAFVDKGTGLEVAYISNERFYTPKLTVLEDADFGGYRMAVSNGITFKWVGRE